MKGKEISLLELNAHLTKLTQGTWDAEAARTVVRAFAHLKPRSKKVVTTYMGAEQRGVFKGHTAEAGDVSMATDRRELKETVTGEDATQRARVGYFKVFRDDAFRSDNGCFSVINIEHFWGTDLATRNPLETPRPMHGVEYCMETLEPCALLVYEWEQAEATFSLKNFFKILLSLGSTRITRIEYRARRTVLYGKAQRIFPL